MSIAEKRSLGVIIRFTPDTLQGVIRDVQSKEEYSFGCQDVRSDTLRHKLFQTSRFDRQVYLEPNIYVSYVPCQLLTYTVAGRIELVDDLPPERDLGAPIIGYIQNFGLPNEGSAFGWINAVGFSADQESIWFDMNCVADPILQAYLKEHTHLRKEEWLREKVQIRCWKLSSNYSNPKAFRIAMLDEELRQQCLRKYRIDAAALDRWEQKRDEYLYPAEGECPAYRELPIEPDPLTPQEQEHLDAFYKEAFMATSSNPAHRGQLDALWQLIGRSSRDKLAAALEKLPNIRGTRLALLCEAACRYLDADYADALELCCNAQRYDFAAQLALSMEKYAIAQRIAEAALNMEPDESRIQLLTQTAAHTGNALAFCNAFQEMIDASSCGDALIDECEIFVIGADQLLQQIGVESDSMELIPLCTTVWTYYANELPTLRELLAEERRQEAPSDTPTFVVPASRLPEPVYYVAAPGLPKRSAPTPSHPTVSMDDFKRYFTTDGKYRQPRPADKGQLSIIDQLLAEDNTPLNECRMPLLVRLCLDAKGSTPHISHYLKRLEQDLASRRRKPGSDRRWRLFSALQDYVQATDDAARTGAWTRARNETQGNDEPLLLDSLPH